MFHALASSLLMPFAVALPIGMQARVAELAPTVAFPPKANPAAQPAVAGRLAAPMLRAAAVM